ncbi:MAG TPA: tRNA 2-thiouridine(34) synthase MnmA [Anaerohalosphaeraceae bacterium]|nr:tRNA 2-thiouridine(34) synthase MnmA [Anaerohalosphaeraceae bacterium]HOL88650.1 tRNA 2-thiouridine(34) synthase MnmA [Anaerohalosphaeraceae bacterium]HPP56202.1 tRNA 2-thiouridine(34) synthase MnmA [Anaerohalosphaeraceae bacterium]
MTTKRVFAAVSGGVDSSTAAALLCQQGYDCAGVFMITHDRFQPAMEDAETVCRQLGIPFYVLDLRTRFEQILDYFCDTYLQGKTPNPCVLCNRIIKFGLVWDFAREHGADFLATGHYARILCRNGQYGLYQASNTAKDQSYVLSMVRREMLSRILLPMAEQVSKEDTRQTAQRFGLHTHSKEDSQEICFIPDDDYAAVLAQRRPTAFQPGPIVDTAGKVLGQHNGIHHFTIGQRRGLRIALGKPAYVVRIDATTHTVVLGSREELASRRLLAEQINWLVEPPAQPFRSLVKIRYNHGGAWASVTPLSAQTAEVVFDEPVSAVTPGQAAVFYQTAEPALQVAGGGWIAQAIRE